MAVERTYSFYAAGNIKDDVRDSLFMVSPNDTPLLAMLGRRKVRSKVFDWLLDDLPRPTTTGDPEPEASLGAQITGQRLRMIGHIEKESRYWQVSRSQMEVDQYAVANEYEYKAQKAFLYLAKLFEAKLLWQTHAAYGSDAAEPAMHGIIPWLCKSGAARDAGDTSVAIGPNSSPALADEYFSTWYDCFVNSTVLGESLFNERIQAAWEVGTDINSVFGLCGGAVKRRLSDFNLVYNQGTANDTELSESINRTMQKEIKSRQVSMDRYDSDFGAFNIVLHRDMNANFSFDAGLGGTSGTTTDDLQAGGDDTVVFMDPAFFHIAEFRDFEQHDLAPTDDSIKGYVVAEMGVEVGNPKGGFGISRVDNAA